MFWNIQFSRELIWGNSMDLSSEYGSQTKVTTLEPAPVN